MGIRNKYPYTREWPNHYLKEGEITEEDIQLSKNLLTKMGYDVDSEIPIWIQFHIRHGLSIEE